MRNLYHTCKFSTLTINFPDVWPRQILDLGKQFKLMIRLENMLKTSLQDVLKMYWRRLEHVLKKILQGILKTFWWRLEDVLKTSWRCLEDVLKTYGQDEHIGLDQDVWLVRIYSSWSKCLEDVFWRRKRKTSSRRLHQDKCLLE